MKKSIFIVIFFLFFNSCSILWKNTPSFVKENFTFLYDEEYMGIDTLINIQGFYVTPRKIIDHGEERISNSILLFYEDGICVKGALSIKDSNVLFHEKITPLLRNNNVIHDEQKDSLSFFYQLYTWGKYEVKDDTIKTQFVYKGLSLNDGWEIYQNWYKVINRNQIQETSWIKYDNSNKKWIITDYKKSNMTPLPSRFIPLDTIPSSDAWIKKEKWFWKDEAGWKAYMERQKK